MKVDHSTVSVQCQFHNSLSSGVKVYTDAVSRMSSDSVEVLQPRIGQYGYATHPISKIELRTTVIPTHFIHLHTYIHSQ